MTTEAQQDDLEPEVTETEEPQEVATESDESREVPPEGEAVDAEANEKEQARANFRARQQKQKEDAEKLKQENEYLRQLVNPPVQAQPKQQAPVNNMPQLEDFETEGEWLNAVLDARETQRVTQRAVQEKNQTYAQKLQEYSKVNKEIYAYEDETVRVINGNPELARAIMESEKAPQIVEAIALDPSKADSLKGARDHYSLARSIIALENSVGDKPTFSDAPPPAKVGKGEPVVSSKPNLSKMTKAEYIAHRQKQRNR